MATVEQTMMKVQRILTGPMNLQITMNKDIFNVRFTDSSTAVYLRVQDWGKNAEGDPQTLVLVWAPLLREVKATPALFEWVARSGGSKWFGHVEIYDSKEPGALDLIISHTLVGDFLDQKELEAAMWGVLGAADGWDDELQAKFGGKRWVDA